MLLSRCDQDVIKLIDLVDVSKLLHFQMISFQKFKFSTFFVPVAPRIDQEVIKLLPFQIPSFQILPFVSDILLCTTVVPLPIRSTVSLSVCADVYHVQNLVLSPSLNIPITPYPIPVQDDLKLPQFYYSIEDFQYLLHFKCVFRTEYDDSDDEIGQWCYGAYKRVDCKVKPVPGRYPEDAQVI